MTPEQVQQMQQMIDDSIKTAMLFATKKYGDTPTDAFQLVPKNYVDSAIAAIAVPYTGAVASGGTALTPFPSGWTCTRVSTGHYTVTHNLNNANYAVVVTPINLAANVDNVVNTIQSIGVNDFKVEFVQSDSPATYINTAFNFIMKL